MFDRNEEGHSGRARNRLRSDAWKQVSAPVLEETGHKIGRSPQTTIEQQEAKSLKTVGGPLGFEPRTNGL